MKTITTTFIALVTSMFFATSAIAAICGGTPCVNSADVIDGSLLSKDLAPKTVSGVQIRNGAVFPNKLSAGAKPAGVVHVKSATLTSLPLGGGVIKKMSAAITTPGPGNIIVQWTGELEITKTSAGTGRIDACVNYRSTLQAANCPWSTANAHGNVLVNGTTSAELAASGLGVDAVTAAGTYSYTLGAALIGSSSSGRFNRAEMTLTFVPATY